MRRVLSSDIGCSCDCEYKPQLFRLSNVNSCCARLPPPTCVVVCIKNRRCQPSERLACPQSQVCKMPCAFWPLNAETSPDRRRTCPWAFICLVIFQSNCGGSIHRDQGLVLVALLKRQFRFAWDELYCCVLWRWPAHKVLTRHCQELRVHSLCFQFAKVLTALSLSAKSLAGMHAKQPRQPYKQLYKQIYGVQPAIPTTATRCVYLTYPTCMIVCFKALNLARMV